MSEDRKYYCETETGRHCPLTLFTLLMSEQVEVECKQLPYSYLNLGKVGPEPCRAQLNQ